jgi:hypothetical protein
VLFDDQLYTTIARVALASPSIRPGVAGRFTAWAGATSAPAAVRARTVTSTMPAFRMVSPAVDVGP